MKKLLTAVCTLVVLAAVIACNDETPAPGSSLVEGQVEIVVDSLFTIDGIPDATGSVRSRTTLQLLGRYSARGFGQFESDIVCQYMPASAIDTANVKAEYIDSVKLCLTMYRDGFAGDSTAPMGLSVYPLIKQLPSPIFSDFDPTGYFDPSPIGSTSYSALIGGYPFLGVDTEGAIYKDIYVDLPVEIGRQLYNKYITEPEVFNSPTAFAKWFPGLYIANTFGSGRVTRFSSNTIDVYYHASYEIGEGEEKRDTIIPLIATYLGVTPEVITNNNIKFDIAPELKSRAEQGEPILVGPLGYEVEFKFPAREILERYNSQSGPLAIVNGLSFFLPAKDISNDYGLTPPPYVLLIKKSEKEKFFADGKINDDKTSFYAAYSALLGGYTFSSMLDYINDIIDRGEVTADDEEFVICPVLVSYYSSNNSSNYYYGYSYYYGSAGTSTLSVSSITPYVTEPVMTLLDFPKAKIQFSFSKQAL
ncbi:MAG: DUF4270 family protein [Duncaniella sp.]|nr:DUF4270 family protein [Duncaniella sp.]